MNEAILAIRKRTTRLTWLAALSGLLALATGGCDAPTNAAVGTVRLQLASTTAANLIGSLVTGDPPLVPVSAASVTIARVELVPGGHVIVDYGDTPQTFDLLRLDGDVATWLGDADVPVGDYAQLRLVVTGGAVTLASGEVFDNLRVPSGMQTGIKVNFAGPVHVEPGVTVLVAVLDVSRSFVLQGPPRAPRGVLFKPVIHATVMDVAASVAGEVSLSASASEDTPVLIEAVRGTDVVSSASITVVATTTGPVRYEIRFLPPGDYEVRATAGSQTASLPVTLAPGEAKTGVDFTL